MVDELTIMATTSLGEKIPSRIQESKNCFHFSGICKSLHPGPSHGPQLGFLPMLVSRVINEASDFLACGGHSF